jgi:microcystin-dependent protein
VSEPFLGEIKIISWNFPPKGWRFCDGTLLPINQNQALFSILGTTYGGDGRVNFALPNLQGRIPVHVGNGIALGEPAGETTHTLVAQEMPGHTHAFGANPATADQAAPGAHVWATDAFASYSSGAPSVPMHSGLLQAAGGGTAHENMPPYLVLNYIIALQGIFPSQN